MVFKEVNRHSKFYRIGGYTMVTGVSANEIEYNEFCRFREKYKNQIMKIQRKMDYFLFREKNFIKDDVFLEDLFLESILVDIRALLMENTRYKKNYTLQNNFKINSLNEEDINFKVANEIDKFLNDTLLPDREISFFDAVKFYTDKYIAHSDNTSIADDEKKARIKEYFLSNEEFGLVFTVKAIIEYAKDIERKIQFKTFEELTKMPESVELEDINIIEPPYSLDIDIDSNIDIYPELIDEILRKSSKDIAYLIGFDVRGLRIHDVNTKFVTSISDIDLMEFIIRVKETPDMK